MSHYPPFTLEEVREWDEMELQKRKEDTKQFFERGLPINARHEKYRQMRAEMSKNIEVPVARERLEYRGKPEPSYLLDSTAKAEEAQSGDPKLQRLLTSPDQVKDGSSERPSAIQPAEVDASARLGFRTYKQDMDSPAIQSQAANRYSDVENTYSALDAPFRDLDISRIKAAPSPSDARNPNPQQTKVTKSTDSCDQYSYRRSFPAPSSIDHGDKYTIRISMYSPRSGNWHALVARLDSQSTENWIVQPVADRLKLKIGKDRLRRYSAFNNEEISSDVIVKATWCKGGGNTHEHIFRVIEKAPFQVLFGTNLLDSDEIKWFKKMSVSDDVLVLTQKDVDEKEQEEIKHAEKLAEKESAMLAKKSQTVKRGSKVPPAAPQPKLKP